jgi:hypothetical protein
MRKKGLIFLIIAALLFWIYIYFFKNGRLETGKAVRKAAKSATSALYRANRNLLQSSIDDFHNRTGRYPRQLSELVSEGFIVHLPAGNWQYDNKAGKVK